LSQQIPVGTVLGGRYEITAQIIVTAETDMILDGMDQILSRKVSVVVASPARSNLLENNSRVLNESNPYSFQMLDMGITPEGSKYLITSYTAPSVLLDALLTEQRSLSDVYDDEAALGTEIFGATVPTQPAAMEVIGALRRCVGWRCRRVCSRRGGVGGDNLVLTGVAISEMLSAANNYLISQASLPSAESAKAWQYGSFNAISWGQVRPLALAALVLLSQVVWLVRPAGLLEMGDDAATSLGLQVGRVRGAMLGYGVVLAAICVATAGPIGFIALAAPQLARRLSRSAGITMITSAAMGALLLGGADFLAQRLLSPFQIPVGLVSAAVGGFYLIWLLMFSSDRRGRTG